MLYKLYKVLLYYSINTYYLLLILLDILSNTIDIKDIIYNFYYISSLYNPIIFILF